MGNLEELNQKVDKVLWYLENNDKTGEKGLVYECSQMRKDLDGLLQREKIKLAVNATIASIFGVLGTGLIFLIKHFISMWNINPEIIAK